MLYRLAPLLLIVPAVALVGASFAMNGYFWHATMSHDPAAQWLWVGVSILCGLLKVAIPVFLAVTLTPWSAARSLAALFAVALAFDVLSGLGFSAMTRGDAMANRQHDAAPVAELIRQRTAAEADLAKYSKTRLTARVDVERKAAAARARDCGTRKGATSSDCEAVALLDAELTEARERDRLAAVVADLSGKLATAAPPRDTDPQITAILSGLALVGITPDRETLSKLFGLLIVLLVELGSTAAPRAAFEKWPSPRRPADPVSPADVQAADVAAKPRRPGRKAIDPLDVVRSACAGRMTLPGATLTADGWLYVSQRAIATVTGLSAPTVNRKLKDAERANTILVKVDGRGTAIRLNPAQAAAA